MASYWDEINRDHCAGPPGVVHGSFDFKPNCWAGIASRTLLAAANYPMLNVGVVNYSLEFWHRAHNVGEDPGMPASDPSSVGFWNALVWGAGTPQGPGVWRKHANGLNDRSRYRTRIAPLISVQNLAPAVSKWRHHALNMDRAGNMTMYRDGVVVDFVGINAANIGIVPFVAWVAEDSDVDSNWTDWHNQDGRLNGIIGPVAAHINSLLTVAQMRDSMERRYVNLLATTQLLYDWRSLDGVTGWDGDKTHIISGISGDSTVPIAAPEGADGTVIVPDLSGNDNDWLLKSRASYDATIPVPDTDFAVPGLSVCAFASDPFFRHGGLP